MAVTTTDHADTTQLLNLATPALYRKNLFRVLGVPVTATPQDVRRRRKRLDMARKLGTHHGQINGRGLLALRDPGEEEIRVALERLSDPKSRLFDEVFWFWPIADNVPEDPGLAALERGDVQGALDAWAAGPGNAAQEAAKAHNRAVLNHLIALELDAWIAARSDPKVGSAHYQDPRLKASALWGNALAGWRAILDNEPFWKRVKHRVHELDDPQLTTGMVRRLRETLPSALLNINAQIALSAAERGDEALAQAHVSLLYEGAVDRRAAEDALRAALAPIRHRIESLCEQATKKAEDNVDDGAEAASDILEQTKPLLHMIDLLLAEQDVSRSGTHDAVADAALKCLIPYGNKTEKWQEMVRLLTDAISIVEGEAQRMRMAKNLKQAQRNHEEGLCFFCEKEQADSEKAEEIKMFGDVNQIGMEITWRHITIKVPRCGSCASIHNRRSSIGGGAFFLVGIPVLITVANAVDVDGIVALFVGGCVALGIGGVAAYIAAGVFAPLDGRKNDSAAKEFPSVKDLVADGWEFGEKPDTD